MWMDDDEELAIYINRLHEKLSQKIPNLDKKQTRYIVFCILELNDTETRVKRIIENIELIKFKKKETRQIAFKPVFKL